MRSLFSTALFSASFLSSNALYIPDDKSWQFNSKNVPHTVHSLQARADFVQGNCQNGQIMDPDLAQTKNDLYPVCITKEILPCPAGQFPTHATLQMKSVCVPDPSANKTASTNSTTAGGSGLTKDGRQFKKPSDPNMFYFRTAKVGNSNPDAGSTPGPSSVLSKAWELQIDERTTPARKQQLVKMKFTTKDLQKEKQEQKEKVKLAKMRREKQRVRRSACLAIGAMTWIPEKDSNNLSDEEMEGLMEPDEDDLLVPDVDIEDYMVTLTAKAFVTGVQMETAGPNFGALLKSLFQAGRVGQAVGKFVSSTGRIGGAAGRVLNKAGGKTRSERLSMLKNKNGKSSPVPKKSVDAAKKSDTVKSILKDKNFQDCLKIGAKLVAKELLKDAKEEVKREEVPTKIEKVDVGQYLMTIDLKAKPANYYPSPEEFGINAIIMVGDDVTDAGGKDEADMTIQTYPDNYNRPGRIPYEHCMAFNGMDNKLTLLQTWGGSCAYYDDRECKQLLFAQTNREDGQLRGGHDNAVSSAWCTFDLNIDRAPGQARMIN